MGGNGEITHRPPTLADIGPIRATITGTGARLLIVDVLMAYLPGKVDSHRDQDVRAVLHRIADMADATGCTVLLLRHLNKSGSGSPLYPGRRVHPHRWRRAGRLPRRTRPGRPDLRVLACVKSNLAAMPESLARRSSSTT